MGDGCREASQVSDVQVERAVLKVLDDYIHEQEMLFILGDFSMRSGSSYEKLELIRRIRDDVDEAIRNVYRDFWQQREGDRDKPEEPDASSGEVGTPELW